MSEPKLIEGIRFNDDRGCVDFCNDFNFYEAGIKRSYKITHNRLGFVRAWHGHRLEDKYVQVHKGDFRVVCLKMAPKENKPVMEYKEFYLSENKAQILFIPKGYYNGFQNLTEKGIIQFYSTTTLEEAKNDDYRLDGRELNDSVDFWNLEKYR